MNTAIVHYHARPGGVTRVVERSVEALGPRAHCLFFTGEAAHGETPLNIRVVPNLGYSAEQNRPSPDLLKQAREAFGAPPDVWHIHNHSLGKNPVLTAEVLRLADANQKILLQIHDFAEDGRPANYRNLAGLLDRLYPVAEHIHYAVLNNRDYRFLHAAGIPESNLHLLPNAVSPLPATQSLKSGTQSLFVYPCRAIRRKNIGELLLWSALMPDTKFAVTLAPKNPDVKPIYDAWRTFADQLGLNVEFDAGANTPFEELIASADALITTSIAEGFGLAFLEPWTAGKPLTGRNLPEITADFAAHGLDLSALYSRLPVPLVSPSPAPGAGKAWNISDKFFQRLEKALRATYESYRRPWNDRVFNEAKNELIQEGCVDFGLLDEDMQRTLIRAAREHPDLIQQPLGDSSEAVESNRKIVETAYSPAAYGEQLSAIYQQLLDASPGAITFADSEQLLDRFLQPFRTNLLRS